MRLKRSGDKPPKLGKWLLEQIISRDIRFAVLGDFDEYYAFLVKEYGGLHAGLWYWFQVMKSFPPFIIDLFFWRIDMVRNYFKVAFRN